jgi:hypothetical protein
LLEPFQAHHSDVRIHAVMADRSMVELIVRFCRNYAKIKG